MIVLDIPFCRDLYFPTMVGWVNRHKKAHLAATAENQILIKTKLIFFLLLSLSIIGFYSCKKKTEEEFGKTEKSVEKHVTFKTAKTDEITKAEEFIIRTVPADGGFIQRTDQPLYIYFSKAVEAEDFSFEVYPKVQEWEIGWHREGKLAILKHTQLFQVAQTYILTLSIRSLNIEKKIKFNVFGPSSLELIDKDEKENLIDIDTAWTYRLQAIFEPSILPLKYRSETPSVCGTGVIRDFKKIQPKLKPQTLQNLKPYLVPPTHPESIFSTESENESQKSASFGLFPNLFAQSKGQSSWGKPLKCNSAPVKIWYKRGEEKVAENARTYIDSGDFYNRFKQLMANEPPSDAGEKDNGGDGNLDIYLVRLAYDGQCIAYEGTQVSPSYILINKSLAGTRLLAALAHELFHAFQFAYDQYEDEWWLEGTAVWAEDYADEHHNHEQDFLSYAFFIQENRLETITDNEGYHPYGIYLFPFYLSKNHGDKIIGDIWIACGELDALTAVENKAGDLKELVKDFAYKCLDQGPAEASYPDSGGPLRLYELHWAKEVVLKTDKRDYDIEVRLPPLSAVYFDVYNRCEPEKTPHIKFDLRGIKAFNWLTVQAIIDPNGEAKEEDWTGRDERSFCINREEEKFEEIVIVISSSDKVNPVMADLDVDVDAKGCVEADATLNWTTQWLKTYFHKDESGYIKWEKKETGVCRAELKLRWTHVDGDHEDEPEISEHYDVISYEILEISGNASEESEHHSVPPSSCDSVTRCQGNGTVSGGEKQNDPNSLTIRYDLKSGRVKSVHVDPLAAFPYWKGKIICEHTDCRRSWRDEQDWYPVELIMLDWGPWKETAFNASGDIKSQTITGGGSHTISHPKGTATLTANYTISIKRKK